MEDVYCWEHGEETENERGLWENKRGAHWGALSITGYAQWCSLWRLDKRKIPVVLLATEEQEAEVCHYVGFEDVPNREKMLHIETQLRGTLQTTENMGKSPTQEQDGSLPVPLRANCLKLILKTTPRFFASVSIPSLDNRSYTPHKHLTSNYKCFL